MKEKIIIGLFKRKEKKDIENKQKICPINRRKKLKKSKQRSASQQEKKNILTSKDSIYKRGPNCPN